MTAGVAAQEPLWGVQHRAGLSVERCSSPDAASRRMDYLGCRALGLGCPVVVSADGGRTWQPSRRDAMRDREAWAFCFWVLCAVVAVGGLLTVLAGILVGAWVDDGLGLRIDATGAVAFVLGGVPCLVAAS